jgi:hypothetical protein
MTAPRERTYTEPSIDTHQLMVCRGCTRRLAFARKRGRTTGKAVCPWCKAAPRGCGPRGTTSRAKANANLPWYLLTDADFRTDA